MTENMGKWPSNRGPISKIMPSDGCKGNTVPLAVERWYDFPIFGGIWEMSAKSRSKVAIREISVKIDTKVRNLTFNVCRLVHG